MTKEGENAVGETLSLEKNSPTADFGEISGDFTPPEGAAYARLIVSLGENGKSGDEYKLDNAYLYIYGTAAPIYADEAGAGYSAGEWARYPDGNGKKWENTASRYMKRGRRRGGDRRTAYCKHRNRGRYVADCRTDSVPQEAIRFG